MEVVPPVTRLITLKLFLQFFSSFFLDGFIMRFNCVNLLHRAVKLGGIGALAVSAGVVFLVRISLLCKYAIEYLFSNILESILHLD